MNFPFGKRKMPPGPPDGIFRIACIASAPAALSHGRYVISTQTN